MQNPPLTSFQILFRDSVKRAEVRRIVYEAFGTHFVLDPTDLGQLRVRMSERAPTDELEERGLHAEAIEFHRRAQFIHVASDGVKAFTGIIIDARSHAEYIRLVEDRSGGISSSAR